MWCLQLSRLSRIMGVLDTYLVLRKMADGATMDETSGSKKGTWCKKKAPGPREQRYDPDASGDSANPKN